MNSGVNDLCEVESSLCMDDSFVGAEVLERKLFVSQAMRTRFVTVRMSTLLLEAVTLMLAEKQSCALIVDDDNNLVGFLKLQDIQEFSRSTNARKRGAKKLLVSELCASDETLCEVPWIAVPNMTVSSASMSMIGNGMTQVPVVSEPVKENKGCPVGLLDRQCISITCRALATRNSLQKLVRK